MQHSRLIRNADRSTPPASAGVHHHEPRLAWAEEPLAGPEVFRARGADGRARPRLSRPASTEVPAEFAGLLLEAQEMERRAIARELHDDVTQRLAAMAMELAAVLPRLEGAGPQVMGVLAEMLERLRRLSSDVHTLSRSMHPHALETLGLSRSLESECASFAQRTGLAVRAAIGTVDARLPADLALAAFRIGQEALRNIEKHARATSTRVQLSCTGRELRLVVSDNGVGFRSARTSRGIGLASMRERAAAVGAALVVKSAPGQGSEVRFQASLHGRGRP